jgi:hypothetical protein
MKSANELSLHQFRTMVDRIRGLLYLDLDATGREVWNPDKVWSPDRVEQIAHPECQLVPTEATFREDTGLLDPDQD